MLFPHLKEKQKEPHIEENNNFDDKTIKDGKDIEFFDIAPGIVDF